MSASDKKKLRKEQQAAALTEKQQKEKKEAKKLKAYTLTFVVVMALIVAIVLGVTVRTPIAGFIDRQTHAITIGEHKLSTTDFSYFYVDAINAYYNETYNQYYNTYGNYWQLFLPFDGSKPLNEQIQNSETNATWADYFMNEAVETAQGVFGLYDLAVSKDHKLTNEEQEKVDSYLKSLDTYSSYYGYSNTSSYLRNSYGDGANYETYSEYYKISSLASSYFEAYADSLEFTDADYRAYEKGKFNDYSSFSYAIYLIESKTYLKDSKNATAEDKEAALQQATKDAEALVASGADSIVKFDEAIKALAINAENKTAASTHNKDIFYKDITNSDLQRWIGNSNRKVGEIVSLPITEKVTNPDKTTTLNTTGYYVVMFLGRNDNNTNLVDVRHVLLPFEGGTKDANGNVTYTPAEKAAAVKKAEEMLDLWKKGETTPETFAELANKNSKDSDGKDGGLYTDVYPGRMTTNFNDWCFDETRKPGDTAVVETEYGAHIMYFERTQDITFRNFMIKNELTAEKANEWKDGIAKAMEVVKVNLSGMEWDFVSE